MTETSRSFSFVTNENYCDASSPQNGLPMPPGGKYWIHFSQRFVPALLQFTRPTDYVSKPLSQGDPNLLVTRPTQSRLPTTHVQLPRRGGPYCCSYLLRRPLSFFCVFLTFFFFLFFFQSSNKSCYPHKDLIQIYLS